MGSRRTGNVGWRGALAACGMVVLLGAIAAPAAHAAEPPDEPVATATMIELGVEAPKATQMFDVIVTVQVVPPETGTPEGTVELLLDGTSQGSSALVNGSATFTVSVENAGSHELEAQYQGADGFEPSGAESIFAADAPPDAGFGRPDRPLLPRGAGDLPTSPAPAAPASSALPRSATAEMPTELAFTGAFALPGLFLGLSSIGVGLACRRYARGS